MAEILPDGSFGGYTGYCQFCSAEIKTNIQGNEIGQHECLKTGDSVKFNKESTAIHHNVIVDEISVYSSDGKLLFDKKGTVKVNV